MDLFALIDDPKMRTLLIAAATIAVVFILTRVVRGLGGNTAGASRGRSPRSRRFGEAAARDSFVEPPPTAPGQHRPDRPQAIDDWEVRMHETARELIGRIDAKLAALQALTHEADRAAARLEQALAAASCNAAPETSGIAAASDASAAQSPDDSRPIAMPANKSQELAAESRELSSLRADQADALRIAGDRSGLDLSSMPPSESRRHEEIYLLADYGFDSTEIAHRTGVPIGEVELILRLRTQS